MNITDITKDQKDAFNACATHPLQSYEWGEFREKTRVKVVRHGFGDNQTLKESFQLTIHPVPKTPWTIGYIPKGTMPTKEMLEELRKIGKEQRCIFIQLEPNVEEMANGKWQMENLVPSAHPLFTKYTFILDLTLTEEELLKNMHPKTRYNIRVAQKRGVTVVEDNSDEAFAEYEKLVIETTTRQKFYAHSPFYRKTMWQTLRIKNHDSNNELQAHLFLAKYKPEDSAKEKVLTAWILFTFHDMLYYPYGASSTEHREVMASNLIMWEVIKFGKKLRLTSFDMWGAMGAEPDAKDPWYGFHRFKQGYGARHVTFIGSYDLVINPMLYEGYKIANKLRWMILKMKK